MKKRILYTFSISVLAVLSCQKEHNREIQYKEYTSPDKSYVVSVPEQIPTNKCIGDFMSFVKDDYFIIIQRVSADYLSDGITKINNESGKFTYSQIEVSDTSILYQATKGLLTAYKYYLLKKLPTANYMISVSLIKGSKSGIKDMGSRIYNSLKPYQVAENKAEVIQDEYSTYSTSYYSIKYPKGWKIIENYNEMTDAYIGSQQEEIGFSIVRFETDYSLSEAHTEGVENKRQAGFRVLEDKQINLSGVKCYRTLTDVTIQGKAIKHLSYTFKKGDMLYGLSFGNVTTKERENLCAEIANSFCFK